MSSTRVSRLEEPQTGSFAPTLDHKAFRYRLARFLMIFLSRFCILDSECLHQKLLKRYRLFKERKEHTKLEQVRARRGCVKDGADLGNSLLIFVKENLWPCLVLSVYIYTTIKFALNAYYITLRYRYLMKLKLNTSLSEMENESNEGSFLHIEHNSTDEREQVKRKLDVLEESLRSLGSPYSSLGPFAAVGYLMLIDLTLMSYIFPQLYYNYVAPMSFFLTDLLKDEPLERAHCQALVCRQLQTFRNSAENNIELVKQSLWKDVNGIKQIAHEGSSAPQLPSALRRAKVARREKEKLLHVQLALEERGRRLWRRLEQSGRIAQLQPINRSPEWVDKLIVNFNSIVVGNAVYSFVFDISIAFGLPHFAGIQLHLNYADVQSMVEMFALAEINVLTTGYNVALLSAHCTDQTEYIAKLSEELSACLESNRRMCLNLMHKCSLEPPPKDLYQMIDRVSDDLNLNLLDILLKYRIFIAQLKPVQKGWHSMLGTCLNVVVVLPLMMRLYAPYTVVDFRLLGLACSLTFLGYVDMMLLPICKFHVEGNDLYKRLWSLLAHTMEVEAHSSSELKRNLYDEGVVAILRKELSHPDKVIEQFVTKSMGLQATFPKMVEMHYYYGILMISLFSELQSWRVLFGERLNDPLGLL